MAASHSSSEVNTFSFPSVLDGFQDIGANDESQHFNFTLHELEQSQYSNSNFPENDFSLSPDAVVQSSQTNIFPLPLLLPPLQHRHTGQNSNKNNNNNNSNNLFSNIGNKNNHLSLQQQDGHIDMQSSTPSNSFPNHGQFVPLTSSITIPNSSQISTATPINGHHSNMNYENVYNNVNNTTEDEILPVLSQPLPLSPLSLQQQPVHDMNKSNEDAIVQPVVKRQKHAINNGDEYRSIHIQNETEETNGAVVNHQPSAFQQLMILMEEYRSEAKFNMAISLQQSNNTTNTNAQSSVPSSRRTFSTGNRLVQSRLPNQPRHGRSRTLCKRRKIRHCPVCLEKMTMGRIFRGTGRCRHWMCTGCAIRMLIIHEKDNKSLPIPCPQCPQLYDLTRCLRLINEYIEQNKTQQQQQQQLDEVVYDKLQIQRTLNSLQSAYVEQEWIKRKAYCANPKCNTPFDWDVTNSKNSKACPDISRVTCPLCKTETCASCRVPWHLNKSCVEFLGKMDLENDIHRLIVKRKWTPCPKCGHVIEKTSGCNHITCQCGCNFCYRCGQLLNLEHNGRCIGWTR